MVRRDSGTSVYSRACGLGEDLVLPPERRVVRMQPRDLLCWAENTCENRVIVYGRQDSMGPRRVSKARTMNRPTPCSWANDESELELIV